jgi:hypothetical protein
VQSLDNGNQEQKYKSNASFCLWHFESPVHWPKGVEVSTYAKGSGKAHAMLALAQFRHVSVNTERFSVGKPSSPRRSSSAFWIALTQRGFADLTAAADGPAPPGGDRTPCRGCATRQRREIIEMVGHPLEEAPLQPVGHRYYRANPRHRC